MANNESNTSKQAHGSSAQDGIENILERYLDLKYIKSFNTNFRCGKKGYSNTEQFYAPFLIVHNDNTKWLVYSTTSMRDRFKSQLWDAINIKDIDSTIELALLVYPDGLAKDVEKPFLSKKREILEKEGFYSIDDIVSQNEFINLIENKATKDLESGSRNGILGNEFESRIATLLSYAANLQKWRGDSSTLEGMHYDTFKKIVECFNLNKKDTLKIDATCDKKVIGLLPSGGPAKTDVLVSVTKFDNTVDTYTISCKRSGQTSVTVHDYTAIQFAEIIDPSNSELRELLIDFQNAGSMSGLGDERCKRLTAMMTPYTEKLALWVLGGRNGYGNPDTQWADYILTYDITDYSVSIHPLLDYYRMLMSKNPNQNFGTPFQWTYPSKQRGKRIQLKCKIIK